jgi:transcriptional regulator with XRE-family HTH domain
MNKETAIKLLGGTITQAAEAVGVSASAVSQWPNALPPRISDRVLAVLARRYLSPDLLRDPKPAVCSEPRA